jgi:hypothetical protein
MPTWVFAGGYGARAGIASKQRGGGSNPSRRTLTWENVRIPGCCGRLVAQAAGHRPDSSQLTDMRLYLRKRGLERPVSLATALGQQITGELPALPASPDESVALAADTPCHQIA